MLHFFCRITGLAARVCVEHEGELRRVLGAGKGMATCSVLKDNDPDFAARCGRSDLHHLRLAHQLQRHVIYECHAGLVDIAVPILGLKGTAGVLTGQVLPRVPSPTEQERLVRTLSTPRVSTARLRRAVAKMWFMPEERIEAAAKLLVDLTEYAIRPATASDVTPLRTYVASELLKGQQWNELEGIARQLGVESPPRIAIAIQVLCRGWQEVVDWQGLQRAREVVARTVPSALAAVERDKLVVLFPEAGEIASRVRKLLADLQAAGLRVAIGVGRPCDAEKPIWQSYHEAEMALGYRFLTDGPVVFLEAVERPGPRSDLIPSALADLAWFVRLGDGARAQEILRTLVRELGREPYSGPWVLDGAVEILTLLIRELREAGNKSDALPGVLRHFLNSADRAPSIQHLLALLETSATQLIKQAGNAAPSTAEIVERVCQHVEQHLTEPVALERLCREVLFVSPDHFSRMFHKVKGVRFKEWVLKQRLEWAKELLVSTNEPVACVAARCGYDDHPYFCRVFRRATGLTPTRYRQAHNVKPPSRPRAR
jgi:AraC-like DNA-binding protein/ligand-binding sensor protein